MCSSDLQGVGGHGPIFPDFLGHLARFFRQLGDALRQGLILFDELFLFLFRLPEGGHGELHFFFGGFGLNLGHGQLGTEGICLGAELFLGLPQGFCLGLGRLQRGPGPLGIDLGLLGETGCLLFGFLQALG